MAKKVHHYIRDEIVIHNRLDDIWVIVNSNVLNLTPLFLDRRSSMNDYLRHLLQYAGKDLSTFFSSLGYPITKISGRGVEIPVFPAVCETANSNLSKTQGYSWWNDPMYMIGKVTKQERPLIIINTLTYKKHKLKVCEEDTISEIATKYHRYNHHSGSYIWRKYPRGSKFSSSLNPNRTLTENGVLCETDGTPSTLWIYYNDDFTIA